LKVKVRLHNNETEEISEHDIFMGDLPLIYFIQALFQKPFVRICLNLNEVWHLQYFFLFRVTDSYKWFLEEGLNEVFRDISPIADYNGNLSLEFVSFELCRDDVKYSIEECKERDAKKPFVRICLNLNEVWHLQYFFLFRVTHSHTFAHMDRAYSVFLH